MDGLEEERRGDEAGGSLTQPRVSADAVAASGVSRILHTKRR